MSYLPFNATDWYFKRQSGAVYSTRRGMEMTRKEADQDQEYQAWLALNLGWVAQYPEKDGVESRELLVKILYPAGVRVYPLTPEEQLKDFTAAIQAHLDRFAQTRNYDGIMSVATYATSTVPKFAAEGQYAVEARDMTWAKGYAIMDEVMSGARPMPTIDEVLAELPTLAWPDGA